VKPLTRGLVKTSTGEYSVRADSRPAQNSKGDNMNEYLKILIVLSSPIWIILLISAFYWLFGVVVDVVVDGCFHSYKEVYTRGGGKRGGFAHDFKCSKCGKEKTEWNEMEF